MNTSDSPTRLRTFTLAAAIMCAAAPAQAQEDYIGDIKLVGYTYCPRGTTEAAGQLLPISAYSALFSLYGCTYGGDCRTTFALPDLRGRAPIGQGNGPGLPSYRLGQKGGGTSATLNITQMPAHSHGASTTVTVDSTLHATAGTAEATDPSGNALAAPSRAAYLNTAPDAAMAAGSVTSEASATTTIANAGANQSFTVQDPYLAMRYCVVLEGLFPPRD